MPRNQPTGGPLNAAPLVPLSGGRSIPQVGLGTWPLTDAEVAPVIVTG